MLGNIEPISIPRIESLLEGIPESSHSVVFLEYPPNGVVLTSAESSRAGGGERRRNEAKPVGGIEAG